MSIAKHYLTPDWPAPANIHAATTFRTGGQSLGAFNSLNPALHVGDDVNKVIENRHIIRDMLSLPSEPVWLEQIHSNRVINAAFPAAIQKADASYSCVPNIVCTVMTADCLPLLVCAVDGSQVAAIHAGWRGLLSGIISNTLAFFHQQDVLVWLGPAICCECFEVGTDVYDAFLKKSSAFDKAFKNRGNGKYLADIYLLARLELESLNINKIYCARFCTVCEPNLFYSYRRENITGRMATLIWRG